MRAPFLKPLPDGFFYYSHFTKNNYLTAHNVPLNDFAVFVHQEGGFFIADGASAEPSARMGTAGPFRRPEGRFSGGMKNPSANVDGLLYGE